MLHSSAGTRSKTNLVIVVEEIDKIKRLMVQKEISEKLRKHTFEFYIK